MATVKIKFRPSSVDGREGTVYYQVIHGRVARQINTSCKLFPAEWSKRHSRIVIASSDEDRRQYLLLLDKKNSGRYRPSGECHHSSGTEGRYFHRR